MRATYSPSVWPLLLRRFAVRHWQLAPGGSALLVLILSLGVAVFVSVRLANRAAVSSFTHFTDTLVNLCPKRTAGSAPSNFPSSLRISDARRDSPERRKCEGDTRTSPQAIRALPARVGPHFFAASSGAIKHRALSCASEAVGLRTTQFVKVSSAGCCCLVPPLRIELGSPAAMEMFASPSTGRELKSRRGSSL
jgi:hypothetical protein